MVVGNWSMPRLRRRHPPVPHRVKMVSAWKIPPVKVANGPSIIDRGVTDERRVYP